MRKILLTFESVLLLAPITCALCYTSLLTLVIGLPVSIMSVFNSGGAESSFYVLATLGNIAGVYAVAFLWLLIGATIKEKIFSISRNFKIAIACGVFASFVLIYIYGLLGLMLGVAPPLIAAIHFIYLQLRLRKNA